MKKYSFILLRNVISFLLRKVVSIDCLTKL